MVAVLGTHLFVANSGKIGEYAPVTFSVMERRFTVREAPSAGISIPN